MPFPRPIAVGDRSTRSGIHCSRTIDCNMVLERKPILQNVRMERHQRRKDECISLPGRWECACTLSKIRVSLFSALHEVGEYSTAQTCILELTRVLLFRGMG
ncbi:hypothetical protein JG688_00014438 [Phytophthora aleatoria]|uniref:Uncharacterized protein n=1 Tax=Phytophthora aleatoria TaxID=2496075 RepID=A0A8J5I7T8_9STRA|nr:hypothetical protein JG688_00014438 [Phytophthora aleatoria]